MNSKYREFHLYGGRGVNICERWSDFAAFYEDMGARPTPEHSIDRINNEGNYEPSNCRWATKLEQALNTRKAIKVKYKGEEITLTQFAKAVGRSYSSIYGWFVRRNMPFDDVLKKIQLPVKNRH